ncbi:hypothetical protein ACFYMW_30665 [Streptomyces sp. NPDC006692]|uniref:hypothetical protein n=1 Tax=unclassified Streptomyces TaxID=2593676 RepID=UPI0036AF9128
MGPSYPWGPRGPAVSGGCAAGASGKEQSRRGGKYKGAGSVHATACDAKTWPQPIPAVIGKPLVDAVSGPLLCFDITTATAPDGHNALDDSTTDAARWTISKTTPASGTHVTEHQAVTLQLAARR